MMNKYLKIIAITLLGFVGFASEVNAQAIGQLQAGQVWGNPTGGQTLARGTLIGPLLDQGYSCTAQNSILMRGASLWQCQAPGGTALDNLASFSSTGFLTRTGAGTYVFQSTTNGITLGNIVQDSTAWSLLGNATSGTANYAPFTIGSLTQKVSPAASDLVIIQDQAASGALKYATVSSVGSAGSVGSVNGQTGAVTLLTPPQGRLTLQANTPVMITSQTNQTTIRYDCYVGNQVPYYTGSADGLDTIASCEVTDAMVSAASAGQVVAGQVYDVWWVHSGANRICLAMSSSSGGGGGWASDTGGSSNSRGTGYTQLDYTTRSYKTNKNSISNCFNGATNYGPVSANQGTYLGTVYAPGNGQVSWTLGASASGGTAALLGVWNAYNRVLFGTSVVDNGTSYTYTTATPRQARASSGNQITYLQGIQEDAIAYFYTTTVAVTAAAGSYAVIGVGVNSTSVFSTSSIFQTPSANALNGTQNIAGQTSGLGVNTINAMESGDGSHANTFNTTVGSTVTNAILSATFKY